MFEFPLNTLSSKAYNFFLYCRFVDLEKDNIIPFSKNIIRTHAHTYIHSPTHTYIYIYIYIYKHLQLKNKETFYLYCVS